MAVGRGSSLGRALKDLFSQEARPGGVRVSYDKVSWRSRFVHLSESDAGYEALRKAGLEAAVVTQKRWLAGSQEATPAAQAAINRAYEWMRGGLPGDVRAMDLKISGRVTQGNDSRLRGTGNNPSPLLISGRSGNWSRIAAEWNGDADPDRLEALYVEDVVAEDLGEGSEPWEFDGAGYTVAA